MVFYLYPENENRGDKSSLRLTHLENKSRQARFQIMGLFILMMVCCQMSGVQWRNWYELEHHGLPALATIIEKAEQGAGGNRSYFFEYTFRDNQEQIHQIHLKVNSHLYHQYDVGGRLSVVYSASDPAVHKLFEHDASSENRLCLLPVIALASSTYLLVQVSKWRELLLVRKYGKRVPGKILAVERKQKDKNVYHLTIEYEFRSPISEHLITDRADNQRHIADEKFPQEGTPVEVLFLHDELYKLL